MAETSETQPVTPESQPSGNRVAKLFGSIFGKKEPQPIQPPATKPEAPQLRAKKEQVGLELMGMRVGSLHEPHPIPYQERFDELVPEIARQNVKEFAETENNIMELFCDTHDNNPSSMGSRVTVRAFEGGSHTSWEHGLDTLGFGYMEQFSGIGDGDIMLYRSREQKKYKPTTNYYAALIGIEGAPDVLEVGMHTDEKTREAVESREDTDACKTFYVFGANGKFGKLITLPKEIEDGRPVVDSNYHVSPWASKQIKSSVRWNLVAAEMTPGDFEVVGRALSIFSDRTEKAKIKIPQEIAAIKRGEP